MSSTVVIIVLVLLAILSVVLAQLLALLGGAGADLNSAVGAACLLIGTFVFTGVAIWYGRTASTES